MKLFGIVTVLFGGFLFATAPANSATYDWTLTGTFSGFGTITTNNAPVMDAGSTGQQITGITGTFGGTAISWLGTIGDNLLFPSNFGSDGFGPLKGALDAQGLSLVEGGNDVNVFFAGSNYDVEGFSPFVFSNIEAFSVTSVTSTPLPSTWIMMLAGLAAVALIVARGTNKRFTVLTPA
jgi:hypothetical protein